MTTSLVVWLRAINLGARNKLPMPLLREACTELGFEDVRTHLQSGNVVLSTDLAPVDVATRLEGVLEERVGFRPRCIVRTADEVRTARQAFPFTYGDPRLAVIGFLADDPRDDWAGRLPAADEVAPEQYALIGHEVHVAYTDERGQHASRLTGARFERGFGVELTVRNLRTVDAVVGLLDG